MTESMIRTNSGKIIDLLNPNPDTIVIEDIAHGLSHMPRWSGQTEQFYSVAQHSVRVASYFDDKKIALQALLHDATEAYMMDIPKPLKNLIPEYKTIEENLLCNILKKFGCDCKLSPEIKYWDNFELDIEIDTFWSTDPGYNVIKDVWTPERAKEEFLKLYCELI